MTVGEDIAYDASDIELWVIAYLIEHGPQTLDELSDAYGRGWIYMAVMIQVMLSRKNPVIEQHKKTSLYSLTG